MRRPTLSCVKVSFIPPSFAPPQPKHLFSGLGAKVIVSVNFSSSLSICAIAQSHQRHATALRPPYAALALAHFDAQHIRKRNDPASNLFFVQAGESQAQ